uniref:Uncharacterized protein n=1 Tax=Anopheles dirus TaxID=7168 RepID=A0A182NXF4_9DIPT
MKHLAQYRESSCCCCFYVRAPNAILPESRTSGSLEGCSGLYVSVYLIELLLLEHCLLPLHLRA